MTSYRLTSNPMICTPGVLRWVGALRKRDVPGATSDADARIKFISGMFPALPVAAVSKLAAGDYTVEDNGETAVVTVEEV